MANFAKGLPDHLLSPERSVSLAPLNVAANGDAAACLRWAK